MTIWIKSNYYQTSTYSITEIKESEMLILSANYFITYDTNTWNIQKSLMFAFQC